MKGEKASIPGRTFSPMPNSQNTGTHRRRSLVRFTRLFTHTFGQFAMVASIRAHDYAHRRTANE
jgi:hypothetical protein